MKKVVLKVLLEDDGHKAKVMRKAAAISGVESIFMDTKNMRMTVTGDVDAIYVHRKLMKLCDVELISVGTKEVKKMGIADIDTERLKELSKKNEHKEDERKKEDVKGSAKMDQESFLHGNGYKKMKLHIRCGGREKVMKTIARLAGVDGLSLDSKAEELTIIGRASPEEVLAKLKKLKFDVEVIALESSKEPEKYEAEKVVRRKDKKIPPHVVMSAKAYHPDMKKYYDCARVVPDHSGGSSSGGSSKCVIS